MMNHDGPLKRTTMHRAGIAQVELLLFLPLLVILFLTILTIASAGLAVNDAEVKARHEVWSIGRRAEGAAGLPLTSVSADLGRILGPGPIVAVNTGLREFRQSTRVPIFWDAFAEKLPSAAERSHALFAGPWDFRIVRFPAGRSEHPSLVMGPKCGVFFDATVDLRCFRALLQ